MGELLIGSGCIGERVRTFEQLASACQNKRAVIAPGTFLSRPKPASVVMHQQGVTILRLLRRGIFIYLKRRM